MERSINETEGEWVLLDVGASRQIVYDIYLFSLSKSKKIDLFPLHLGKFP